jgi:hypothetical protein
VEAMRNVSLVTGLPFNVKPIIDITDTLPSRTPDPEPRRTPDQITHISVHHSAVEGATIQSYADYHVNTLGWAHIGYHMVIKGDQIYQTNDLLTKSYHTSGNNGYTVSVSVSGDLSKRPLSDMERNCLYSVILTYMDLFNIPVENVLGHREYPDNNTSCPCIDMNQVRSDIRTLQMRMQRDDSWAKKNDRLAEMGKEFTYLNGLLKAGEQDGNAQWAMSVYMDVYDFMKSKNYL